MLIFIKPIYLEFSYLFPVQNLLNLFNSISPLSDKFIERLSAILKRVECQKKQFLLKEGQTANYIYFIESGFKRSFYIKEGRIIKSLFMKENDESNRCRHPTMALHHYSFYSCLGFEFHQGFQKQI